MPESISDRSTFAAGPNPKETVMTDNRCFDLLLDVANDVLWRWCPADNESRWNAAWHSLTGLAPGTIPKPGLEEWHARLHPDERHTVLHQFEQYLAGTGSRFEFEHRLRNETGDYRWVRLRTQCERNIEGTVTLIAGSFTDISEHKVLDPYTHLPN